MPKKQSQRLTWMGYTRRDMELMAKVLEAALLGQGVSVQQRDWKRLWAFYTTMMEGCGRSTSILPGDPGR